VDGAAVVVTDGLLRNLTLPELAGILAHEIAHIRNSDGSTMALARGITSATELVSLLGLLRLAPGGAGAQRPAAALELSLLLRLAPTVSKLLQLALSRIRELEADLDAAELSGDAVGLARAIDKLDRHHAPLRPAAAAISLFDPGILLRSHPETPTRMHWLLAAGWAAG
jgi:heat shock protein HtpX